MDKKKIVHIIDGLGIGGAERLLFDVVTRLNTDQFEVSVMSLLKDVKEKQPLHSRLEEAGIQVTLVPKKSKLGFGLAKKIASELRKQDADIVHTHLFAADVWGTQAAQLAGVPVVLSTEHNINKDEGWLKHKMKCRARKYVGGIIAISDAVEQYVQSNCSTSVPITQIANGIDLDRFQNASKNKQSTTPPTIAIIARLVDQKGHEQLLRALPYVMQSYHCEIIGDGPLRPSLEALASTLGLNDKVTFRGAINDIAQEYAHIDIVAIPSIWEGFGLVAVEAMATGCVVIASNVDGLQEIIEQEQSGLLVDFTDPAIAATAIETVLEDAQLRERCIEGGRVRAQQFSIETVVQKLEALYNSLV